jgi:hypothetical protein
MFVEVSTFMLRNLAQKLLSALSVPDGIPKELIIFAVRISALYFSYVLFVRFFEKRRAAELQFDDHISRLHDLERIIPVFRSRDFICRALYFDPKTLDDHRFSLCLEFYSFWHHGHTQDGNGTDTPF